MIKLLSILGLSVASSVNAAPLFTCEIADTQLANGENKFTLNLDKCVEVADQGLQCDEISRALGTGFLRYSISLKNGVELLLFSDLKLPTVVYASLFVTNEPYHGSIGFGNTIQNGNLDLKAAAPYQMQLHCEFTP